MTSRRMHWSPLLALLATALAVWTPFVGAQEGPDPAEVGRGAALGQVGVELQVGLIPGEQPPGWIPVEVRLLNQGPSRPVQLTLRGRNPGEQAERLVVRRSLDLPAGGARREWFLIFWPGYYGGQLSLTVTSGAEAEEPAVLGRGGTSFTVGHSTMGWNRPSTQRALYVGREETGSQTMNVLFGPGGGGSYDDRAARSPGNLPDRVEAYAGVHLIVLHDADLGGLSRAQELALRSWLRDGGTVLLVPGRRLSWLEDAALQRVVGEVRATTLEVDGLPRLEGLHGPLRIGRAPGEPLVLCQFSDGVEGEPLTRRRSRSRSRVQPGINLVDQLPDGTPVALLEVTRRGRGKLALAAVDLSQPPFDRWSGRGAVAGDMLLALSDGHPRHHNDVGNGPAEAGWLWEQLAEDDKPSLALAGLLVAVYIVLVGPVTFIAAKRRGRPLRVAAVVPALALLFSGLVFASGYASRGMGTLATGVSALRIEEGSSLAVERAAVSVRSPMSGAHDIELGDGLLGVRAYGDRHQFQEVPMPVELSEERVDGDGVRFPGVHLNTWERALFVGQAVRDLGGAVVLEDVGGRQRLVNRTSLSLRSGVSLEHSHPHRVGPLAPGESGELTRVAAPPEPPSTGDARGRRRGRWGRPPLPLYTLLGDWRQAHLVAALVRQAEQDSGTRARFVGLLERAPSRITVDGDAPTDGVHVLILLKGRP